MSTIDFLIKKIELSKKLFINDKNVYVKVQKLEK